ncbi:MAG: hypothetical protein WCJ85_00955 [Chitinophagaceae bacterium]
MKRFSPLLLLVLSFNSLMAQSDREEGKSGGLKKENIFTGGNVTASFFNGSTILGISPFFGYSINRYLDVAVSGNLNYTSQRDYVQYGDKVRQMVYGPGAFVRLFPVRFLFAQAQYEHNFIKEKYIPASNGTYLPSTQKYDVNSLLIGGGYTSGREGVGSSYYYLSIMWDVAKQANSPYVDGLARSFPVIRAGYQIALFQGKGSRRR